jgi:chromosome segregation ATPase
MDKYENEINELKNNLHKLNELQNENKQYEQNLKNLKAEYEVSKEQSELKSNQIKDLSIRLEEIKKELSVLRSSYSKLQTVFYF